MNYRLRAGVYGSVTGARRFRWCRWKRYSDADPDDQLPVILRRSGDGQRYQPD
ncbi:hypothetical protein ACNKHT_04395 [Shigella flexneri]